MTPDTDSSAQSSQLPRSPLTLGAIITVAIKLADASGLSGASMRQIADALGVGTMTLYGYVANKGELADCMVDALYADVTHATRRQTDRAALITLCSATRNMFKAHPWALTVASQHPTIGPNALAKLEVTLQILHDLGLSTSDAFTLNGIIEAYIYGTVLRETATASHTQHGGQTKSQWQDSKRSYMHNIIESGAYPFVAKQILAPEPNSANKTAQFETSLAKILDSFTGVPLKQKHE